MKRLQPALRWVLAVFFVAAGANHFRVPALYLGMMPPWLPWPAALNVVAGVAEILGGLGLLYAPVRRLAGCGLIALLVAVFPANVHVALQGRMPGLDVSPLTLWLRLPFQALFLTGVWWVALKRAATTPPEPSPANRAGHGWFWLGAGMLVAGVFAVFGPALRGEFLIWDDNISIYENPYLGGLSWARVAWAFADSSQSFRFMPLGWLGYSAVFSLGGLDPAYYHAATLVGHGASAVLLFWVLRLQLEITRPGVDRRWRELAAWLAAASWVFHPLRVEVVAWALTLTYELAWGALLLTWACLLKAWVTGRTSWVLATAASYTISLLLYPVGISAWMAFFILGLWLARQTGQPPIRRWRLRLLLLAIPGGLAAGFALWIRWHPTGSWSALSELKPLGLVERAAQAAYAWAYYLWRPWYPIHVAPIYGSLLRIEPLAGRFLLSGVVVVSGSCLAWCIRRKWPGLAAWWWATAALALPVMGLTEHPFFTSDRFTGLPGLALAALLAGWGSRVNRRSGRWFFTGAAAALLAVCVMISRPQVRRWSTTARLFNYVAAVTPDPEVRAECHLRQALLAEAAGRFPEAQRECDRGLALAPRHRNLRALSDRLAAPQPSVPPAAATQVELARYALQQGDAGAAEAHLRRATRLDPYQREGRIRLGVLLLERREPREALRHFLWVGGSGSLELDRQFLEAAETAARQDDDAALARAVHLKLLRLAAPGRG